MDRLAVILSSPRGRSLCAELPGDCWPGRCFTVVGEFFEGRFAKCAGSQRFSFHRIPCGVRSSRSRRPEEGTAGKSKKGKLVSPSEVLGGPSCLDFEFFTLPTDATRELVANNARPCEARGYATRSGARGTENSFEGDGALLRQGVRQVVVGPVAHSPRLNHSVEVIDTTVSTASDLQSADFSGSWHTEMCAHHWEASGMAPASGYAEGFPLFLIPSMTLGVRARAPSPTPMAAATSVFPKTVSRNFLFRPSISTALSVVFI